MIAEIDGCKAQDTWTLVKRSELPPAANIIPVKWVFKIKTSETGAITKYKARITPKGFKQKHGVDYFEVFANTGKYKTLRVALAIAAKRDMELRQLDVPQAFTQAPLDEDVYMEMPEGFSVDGMVCHLNKSLYGLKQSPRNWYLLASSFITGAMMFRATVSDPCLFWKTSRTGRQMLLFLFVDDMQFAFDKADEAEWNEVHQQLKDRFNITDLGDSKFMLGMRITRDRRPGVRTIKLDQELYITKALEKFGLAECRPKYTPAATQSSKSITPVSDREGNVKNPPANLQLFQEKVGTLLYAAISTRPDISYAVNKLTQKMIAPRQSDAAAADRVFRYLAGTKANGLLFGRNSSIPISAYADADWGSDPTDRKSITGWMVMLNGDIVSWASKKQRVVSQSTCEAELYAEAAAMNELKWMSGLLSEIGQHTEADPPPVLYGDNQSTQELTKNGIKSERTKHIDIKYRFVTDEYEKGRVQLKWIATHQQVADILTKALGGPQHKALCKHIMVP